MSRVQVKFFIIILFITLNISLTGVEKQARDETILEEVVQSSSEIEAQKESETEDNSWIEVEWNVYYSNIGIYMNLKGNETEDLGEATEFEVYRHLLTKGILPTFVVLEASTYPLPLLGVGLKNYAANVYGLGKVTDSFNFIEGVTKGFQEPYAFSLFLGNVVLFSRKEEKRIGGNIGISGVVLTYGQYHIYDNTLIDDHWYEVELKIGGKRRFVDGILRWNYKIGTRFHQNPNIRDIAYIGLKRMRNDLQGKFWSFTKNSGFEYIMDFDYNEARIIRHYFMIDKKAPVAEKFTFGLSIGFVWESRSKYLGQLAPSGIEGGSWQFLIRPNLWF